MESALLAYIDIVFHEFPLISLGDGASLDGGCCFSLWHFECFVIEMYYLGKSESKSKSGGWGMGDGGEEVELRFGLE